MPPSKKQMKANRLNAQKSTGPRSREGKEKVRFNAVTHALTALSPLLPGEERNEFQRLQESLMVKHKPEEEYEIMLVERYALTIWRLRRIPILMAALMEYQRLKNEAQDWYEESRRYVSNTFEEITKGFGARVSDQEAHDYAIQEYESCLQKTRDGIAGIGRQINLMLNEGGYDKLQRYEGWLERCMIKLRHELERVQTRRDKGGEHQNTTGES